MVGPNRSRICLINAGKIFLFHGSFRPAGSARQELWPGCQRAHDLQPPLASAGNWYRLPPWKVCQFEYLEQLLPYSRCLLFVAHITISTQNASSSCLTNVNNMARCLTFLSRSCWGTSYVLKRTRHPAGRDLVRDAGNQPAFLNINFAGSRL